MMSAYHLVERAVEAMKLGAFDYLVKPFHLDDMTNILHRAAEVLALRVRVRDSVESEKGRYDFGHIVTHNPATIKMLEVARKAAEADHTTILILGESGTGKGVLAKAIPVFTPKAYRGDRPRRELRKVGSHSNCLRKAASCCWISATSLLNSRTSFSRWESGGSAEERTWSDAGEDARATSTAGGASPEKSCI